MRSLNFTLKSFLFLAMLSIVVTSCRRDEEDIKVETRVSDFDSQVPLDWNDLYLEIERYAAGYRPGPAPRSLGLMGLAVYEACVAGMPDHNSLKNRFNGMNLPVVEAGAEYHWPTVVHGVYSTMMPKFFPNTTADLTNKMSALTNRYNAEFAAEVSSEVFNRSLNHGKSVGDAMWEYGAKDPYAHDAYKNPFAGYDWQQHYDGPGDWVPTTPGPPQPMFAHWGKVQTFAITESMKLSRPPLPYSESPTSAFYAQALEVYAQNTPSLSYEGKWIGEFWSDDLLNLTFSPGPRWVAIGSQIIRHENSNLAIAIEAYAKVGMALSDAAVACWHSKYYYNLERPESYIQRVIDPSWDCNLDNPTNGDKGFTPPFPAYPSGHSTMGGAGAEALANMFGYSYAMTDKCHEHRTDFVGVPRSFGSLYEMAQENAWSRVPLGVHFEMDCTEGVRHGTVIAREVCKLPWRKK